jgi:UDP-N-acetylmuramate dehydrogenase
MPVTHDLEIIEHAEIPTWFGIGGRADRLVRPSSIEDIVRAVEVDPSLRVLGEGANLLVDDAGVGEIVLEMSHSGLRSWEIDAAHGIVRADAGADLPKLILETVRRGLAGLEGLGGIPASLGGAVMMNAGGAFGQIADVVERVHAIDRAGRSVVRERGAIAFDYRHSGLNDLILTKVDLRLTPGDPAKLRERLKDVMEYKKRSQPMAEKSAGCCFKNPTLPHDLTIATGEIGAKGARVSAGMLIDFAGCKGLRVGGAEVSQRHANFLVTNDGAKARDVIQLMDEIQRRVLDRFGVQLHREVVVWERTP